MIGNSAIRNLIREDKVAQMYSAIQTGGQRGMQTLDQHLKTLLQKGLDQPGRSRGQGQDAGQILKGWENHHGT